MASSGSPASPVTGKKQRLKRTKMGVYTRDVSREDLEAVFHLPSELACKELGVGLTILKRLSRRYGIPRWPYRKSLDTGRAPMDPSAQSNEAARRSSDVRQEPGKEGRGGLPGASLLVAGSPAPLRPIRTARSQAPKPSTAAAPVMSDCDTDASPPSGWAGAGQGGEQSKRESQGSVPAAAWAAAESRVPSRQRHPYSTAASSSDSDAPAPGQPAACSPATRPQLPVPGARKSPSQKQAQGRWSPYSSPRIQQQSSPQHGYATSLAQLGAPANQLGGADVAAARKGLQRGSPLAEPLQHAAAAGAGQVATEPSLISQATLLEPSLFLQGARDAALHLHPCGNDPARHPPLPPQRESKEDVLLLAVPVGTAMPGRDTAHAVHSSAATSITMGRAHTELPRLPSPAVSGAAGAAGQAAGGAQQEGAGEADSDSWECEAAQAERAATAAVAALRLSPTAPTAARGQGVAWPGAGMDLDAVHALALQHAADPDPVKAALAQGVLLQLAGTAERAAVQPTSLRPPLAQHDGGAASLAQEQATAVGPTQAAQAVQPDMGALATRSPPPQPPVQCTGLPPPAACQPWTPMFNPFREAALQAAAQTPKPAPAHPSCSSQLRGSPPTAPSSSAGGGALEATSLLQPIPHSQPQQQLPGMARGGTDLSQLLDQWAADDVLVQLASSASLERYGQGVAPHPPASRAAPPASPGGLEAPQAAAPTPMETFASLDWLLRRNSSILPEAWPRGLGATGGSGSGGWQWPAAPREPASTAAPITTDDASAQLSKPPPGFDWGTI